MKVRFLLGFLAAVLLAISVFFVVNAEAKPHPTNANTIWQDIVTRCSGTQTITGYLVLANASQAEVTDVVRQMNNPFRIHQVRLVKVTGPRETTLVSQHTEGCDIA